MFISSALFTKRSYRTMNTKRILKTELIIQSNYKVITSIYILHHITYYKKEKKIT